LSAAIIPIAVGLVVLLGVYLNLRDNTKKAADATIELTSAQKLMQTVTDEGQALLWTKKKLESLLQTARNENETKANRLKDSGN
jgi:hypothetical protein